MTSITESPLDTGLFNLDEFIGYPIMVVHNYFEKKDWQFIDIFGDYTWVYVKKDMNKTIIIKTECIDNENLGNEIVDSILLREGIYG